MSTVANSVTTSGAQHSNNQLFTEMKSRQQRMWASGNYAAVAAQIDRGDSRLTRLVSSSA